MKKKFKVFPDHCSSGIWGYDDGINYEAATFRDAVPEVLLVALYYWHWVWEAKSEVLSPWTEFMFETDGERIVEAMNAAQDKYEFVYVKSFGVKDA